MLIQVLQHTRWQLGEHGTSSLQYQPTAEQKCPQMSFYYFHDQYEGLNQGIIGIFECSLGFLLQQEIRESLQAVICVNVCVHGHCIKIEKAVPFPTR